MGKFPRKVNVYKCPGCEETYNEKNDALYCCFEGEQEAWECVECEEVYEEKDDAYECCG